MTHTSAAILDELEQYFHGENCESNKIIPNMAKITGPEPDDFETVYGKCDCWKSRLPALRKAMEGEQSLPEHVSRMVEAIIAYPEAYEGFGLELAKWVKVKFQEGAAP